MSASCTDLLLRLSACAEVAGRQATVDSLMQMPWGRRDTLLASVSAAAGTVLYPLVGGNNSVAGLAVLPGGFPPLRSGNSSDDSSSGGGQTNAVPTTEVQQHPQASYSDDLGAGEREPVLSNICMLLRNLIADPWKRPRVA